LILEVDVKYIKDILNNSDLLPNVTLVMLKWGVPMVTTLNGWTWGIMLFNFKLKHVPAERHCGPDALSRR
ncbi:hypothetical protein DICSQDRAFT_35654, partial [Dichomitus squalens LYAD-421 SS1]